MVFYYYMKKISKESIYVKQLIEKSIKFNTETRLRLRKKLNKNLDDIIDGESEIVKAISNIPNKEVKKHRLAEAQFECAEEIKMLKEEDKKTWLIKF